MIQNYIQCSLVNISCSFYILTLKDLDDESFFIVNIGKTSRYYPCFRAEKCPSCSMNESTDRYHLPTTIKRLYIDSKSSQISFSLLELAGITLALSIIILEVFIFVLLFKVTSGKRRWQSLIFIKILIFCCSKSSLALDCSYLEEVTLPYKTYTCKSTSFNMKAKRYIS